MTTPDLEVDGGKAICEILGLDPNVTGSITISFAPEELTVADINMAVTRDQANQIRQELEKKGWGITITPVKP